MPIKTRENKEKKRVFNRISALKCVYCGKDFKSLRSNSLYCGGTCKNYACRDRKKGGKVNSAPSGQNISSILKTHNLIHNATQVIKKPLKKKKSPELIKINLEIKELYDKLQRPQRYTNEQMIEFNKRDELLNEQIKILEQKKKKIKKWL